VNGSDNDQGTEKRPFATLEKARAAIRELRQSGGSGAGGVEVVVRGGT